MSINSSIFPYFYGYKNRVFTWYFFELSTTVENRGRIVKSDKSPILKRSWLTLESQWFSKDNAILFLDGFFPIEIGSGHWILRELILVNQLESKV